VSKKYPGESNHFKISKDEFSKLTDLEANNYEEKGLTDEEKAFR